MKKQNNPVEVKPGVYQILSIFARVTIIKDLNGAIIIDTGPKGSLKHIQKGLKQLGLSLGTVNLIVLTHYHPDHVGGLYKLSLATSAPIAAHSDDAGIISGEVPMPSPFVNRLAGFLGSPFVSLMYDKPVVVDYRLEHLESLPFRDEIKVIHTPGHTAGSICLYVPSQHLLIVGDALQHRLGKLSFPAKPVTQDFELAQRSLSKLLELDFDTIAFSHFAPLRTNAKNTLETMLKRH